MAQYGNFPGVKVDTSLGGIQSVTIGEAEKLLIFGRGNGNNESTPRQVNAIGEVDSVFGDTEIATAMRDALQNGVDRTLLYGVEVPEKTVTAEEQTTPEEGLENIELVEDTSLITVEDVASDNSTTELDVEFRYDGAPAQPTDTDSVNINPLTGEYAADSAPQDHFEFSYSYHDFRDAFEADAVMNVINEDETGIMWALTDSDAVSSQLDAVVSTLRKNYQLAKGFTFAEPNDQKIIEEVQETDTNGGADPRYDTANYETGANQSVSDNAFFKVAPGRVEGEDTATIGGSLAGLYAAKPIDDAVYNEVVSGYSGLQQTINKTEADELRDNDIIPVRSGGAVRVKGNRATNFSENQVVAADFWTRRITDRVILIAKLVGDAIIGRINNPETRQQAEERILAELGQLAADGIIKPNTPDDKSFNCQAYEDSTDRNKVNIDIQFRPYGIVKRVDTSITLDV